jgi:hypothetical protein
MNVTRDILSKLPKWLRAEIENALRKDLTQSELAFQQEKILAIVREHRQQGRRTDLEETSGQPCLEVQSSHSTQAVGALFGEGRTQVEKRLAITRAAKEEPERFGKLVADMDRPRQRAVQAPEGNAPGWGHQGRAPAVA